MSAITPYYRTIQGLLQSCSFAIDEYQREYKWDSKNINDLLNDPQAKFNLDLPEHLDIIRALYESTDFLPQDKDESIQTMYARYQEIEASGLVEELGDGLSHFIYWLKRRKVNYIRTGYSAIYYAMHLLSKAIRRKDLPELVQVLNDRLANDDVTLHGSASQKWRRGLAGFGLNQHSKAYIYHLLARVTAFTDNPFTDKRKVYAQQNFYAASLSDAIYEHQPQFRQFKDKHTLPFEAHADFTKVEQAKRGQLLMALAEAIWSPTRLEAAAHA